MIRTDRKRVMMKEEHQPRLRPHVYLRFDDKRSAWAVLAPEHVYWPDEISLAILKKLDSERTIAVIIKELAEEYEAPPEAVGADVIEFLQKWSDERLIDAGQNGAG